MNISFTTDDIEATAKEMKAKGVEFVRDPEAGLTFWGGPLRQRGAYGTIEPKLTMKRVK